MAPSSSIVVKPLGQMVQAMARFGQNLFQPPSNSIRGVEPDTWYSPLQPVEPIGPRGVEPRGFQYWAGQNLLWTPRADAEYSAADLKVLAQYPLARICIENVKDSIIRVPWTVQLKPKPGENKKQLADRAKGNNDLVKINRFFERPDREHDWAEWVRPLLDDMLVIDAGCVLIRKTFGGEIVELPVLRGDSIVRYIDENGFTPMPPQPAYAQNWWGIPLVNLSTDQLIYKPRNIVPRNTISSQLYGMSPTEQLATEIKIGMQRLQFTLDYYTEGSIPGVVQVVPKGTSPDKIAEAMAWMNSELAGNLAARRQWRMVQGFNEPGKPDQIEFTKEPLLADQFDEMHIRKICFGYGTSPQRLMRMMGTRNAAEQQEAAEIEGLIPWLIWLKSMRDHIVQRTFGMTEFESVFDAAREPDPVKQATQVTVLSSKGQITLNEGREILGQEPRDEPEADMLGIITPNGFIPINSDDLLEQQKTLGTDAETQHTREKEVKSANGGPDDGTADDKGASAKGSSKKKPSGSAAGSNGRGDGGGKDSAGSTDGGGTAKAVGTVIQPGGNPRPNGHAVQEVGEGKTPQAHYGFGAVLDRVDLALGNVTTTGTSQTSDIHMVKADIYLKKPKAQIHPARPTPQSQMAQHNMAHALHAAFHRMERIVVEELAHSLVKVSDDRDALLKRILKALGPEWFTLPDVLDDFLESAALSGVVEGMLQVEVTDSDLLATVNSVARDWALQRGAELVGMRRLDDGTLIPNPDPKWAISTTTRDDLQRIIAHLFEQDSPTESQIYSYIQGAGIFSDSRITMISRTEIARAQSFGNMEAWKQSGKVKTVDWLIGSDHDHDDECDENADASPFDIDDVPDHPAHPNCECILAINEIDVGEDDTTPPAEDVSIGTLEEEE